MARPKQIAPLEPAAGEDPDRYRFKLALFERDRGHLPRSPKELAEWLSKPDGRRAKGLLELFEKGHGRLPLAMQEFSEWLKEGRESE